MFYVPCLLWLTSEFLVSAYDDNLFRIMFKFPVIAEYDGTSPDVS